MPPPDAKPKPLNLLEYHRPKRIRLSRADRAGRIPHLSTESKQCLRNLASHRAKPLPFPLPRSRCAAVLVALFVGRSGDLYVLLNRRSATLRSYAGDTSLPGGKVEKRDRTIEDTARREAFEEIGLPLDRLKVPLLCVLEPFLASNNLVVTPVVVLILDNTLRPILNTAEVASLFSHPLSGFLSSTPPFPTEPELIEVPYHTYNEWTSPGPNGTERIYRAHRFLTGREAGGIKPVFGLTSAILIHAATIAHGREPDFEVFHPNSMTMHERIAWAVLTKPVFSNAYEQEGMMRRVDWEKIKRIAGVIEPDEAKGKKSKRPRRTEAKL